MRRCVPLRDSSLLTMGDIAFQLIIFFMVTTSFMRDGSHVDSPTLPRSGTTESSIAVSLTADGTLTLDGERVDTPEGLVPRIAELLAGREGSAAREVRLRCDRTLPQRVYRPVIEAIADAGGVLAIIHDLEPETSP